MRRPAANYTQLNSPWHSKYMATMRSLAFLAFIAALAPGAARAQYRDAGPVFVGGHLALANPVGQFSENVGVGFGVLGHGRLRTDDDGILSLRLDLGFLNYGNETILICVTTPCRVTGDLTTSNNILLLGIGPELSAESGPIRLYANASVGLAYFATTSSVEGSSNYGGSFASSTNFDDTTFAWTLGPGLQYRLWEDGKSLVSLDLSARYHGNGEARYLRKGDIHDQPDGSIVLDPRQSGTNFWTFGIGISVGLQAEAAEHMGP